MRLPRDLSADELIKALVKLGYEKTRQKGSHIRLETEQSGKHQITIPYHSPIKIGTLINIFNEISQHFEISRDELLNILF